RSPPTMATTPRIAVHFNSFFSIDGSSRTTQDPLSPGLPRLAPIRFAGVARIGGSRLIGPDNEHLELAPEERREIGIGRRWNAVRDRWQRPQASDDGVDI